MRVAHVIKAVQIAGAERHLLTLLPGLRGRPTHDIDAQLILLVEPENDMQHYVDEATARGIPVERLTIQRDLDPSLYSRLSQILRNLKPDIVHTHLLHADLYGIPAARWLGVPVIVSSRHNDNAFRRRTPIKQVNQFLWRMTDAGISISDSIARFSVEVESAAKNKIHRIYYGLEDAKPLDRNAARTAIIQEFGLPEDAILIGIVCRLTEQKGITYGLQAFAKVKDDFPGAHLLIAGDGPLRSTLESEAFALAGRENRVHFLGWREDIPTLMAGLDIFLAPSLWEGFGLVFLEAMAQTVPIIASNVSAIPEVVVDGETGLLVTPRDVDSLAEALRKLLSDKPLRQYMGLQGQDRLETHFSAARMVDETAALYYTLLEMK
jgi:glycosyltransferase involved in cell wall biosynthesis